MYTNYASFLWPFSQYIIIRRIDNNYTLQNSTKIKKADWEGYIRYKIH